MKKQTFMATRGNRFSAFALLFLIFAVSLGLESSYPANANFSTWVPAPTPIYDKPFITFLAPKDYTIVSNQTTILFTVTMPSTWESSLFVDGPSSIWGTIRNVTCTLDQKQILYNDTVYGRDAKPALIGSVTVFPEIRPISINYSCVVSQISSGVHNFTVYVAADTFCQNWETIIDGYHYPCNYYQDVSANESFTFSVNTSTEPSPSPSLSASLAESASALNFGITINFTVTVEGGTAPFAFAWYIDNQLVETGNSPYYSTSTQPVGSHHIYVQVTDADGNTAQTLSPEFNVLPTTSPSPSPSTTQQPTQQPTPTPDNNQAGQFNAALILGVMVVVAVAVGALVYFKRGRGK